MYDRMDFAPCDDRETYDGHAVDCDCSSCDPEGQAPGHQLAAALTRCGWACEAELGRDVRLVFVTSEGMQKAWKFLASYSEMVLVSDGDLAIRVAPPGAWSEDAWEEERRMAA